MTPFASERRASTAFLLLGAAVLAVLVLGVVDARDARAQGTDPGWILPGAGPILGEGDEFVGRITGGIGFRFWDGATRSNAIVFSLSPEFAFGDWAFGLLVELELDIDTWSIRDEDFDEVSDYFNMIRYVRYRRKRADGLFLRYGSLYGPDSRLGHGTLIGNYNTEIDTDSPLPGFQVDYRGDFWGVETLVNDITRWNLLGARGYIMPFHFTEAPIVSRFALGFTFVSDHDAPASLQFISPGVPDVDAEGNVKYNPTGMQGLVVDIELPLLEFKDTDNFIEIVPYVDWVKLIPDGFGDGWHIGFWFYLNLPIVEELQVRIEFRSFSQGYLPTYFNALYEVEKFQYPELDSERTKYQALEDPLLSPALTGLFGALQWGVEGLFTIYGSYEDYWGEPNEELGMMVIDLWLEEDLTQFLGGFGLRVRYVKRAINNIEQIFSLDEHSLLMAQLSYEVLPEIGLGLSFTFQRTWQLNPATGDYEPVDLIAPGVYIAFDF